MVETFIASVIFIGMPLNTFNFLWGNRVFRLTVFILDQITGVGWVVTELFSKIVVEKEMIAYAIFLGIIKGIFRPIMQIITGFWNGNATN